MHWEFAWILHNDNYSNTILADFLLQDEGSLFSVAFQQHYPGQTRFQPTFFPPTTLTLFLQQIKTLLLSCTYHPL